MNSCRKIAALLLILALAASASGCRFSAGEYNDDILIDLGNGRGELIIKEWSFLVGSGAEIYYRSGGDVLIGRTAGGDDGYCPFKDGKYAVEVSGDTVTLRWAFRGGDKLEDWRSQSFSIPSGQAE